MRTPVATPILAVLLLALVGCQVPGDVVGPPGSPPPSPPPPPPAQPPGNEVTLTGPGPFLVSNSVAGASGSLSGVAALLGPPKVYFSLPPGTLPEGSTASVRVLRTGEVVQAMLVGGGLDPVGMEAVAGDTILLAVTGATTAALAFVVPERRPPVIVRTVPPKGKRDVALNRRMQVVLSEPIDPSALTTGALELRSDGAAIPGQLRFGNADQTMLEFVPAVGLDAGQSYEFVVHPWIRDLDGDALGTSASVDFTAGLSSEPDAPVDWAIAFVRGQQIVVATPLAAVQLTATSAGISNRMPAWSPDGTRIAFTSDRDGGSSIYVMNADGSNVARRTLGPEDDTPTWTPDGQSILYSGRVTGPGGAVTIGIRRISAAGPAGAGDVVFDSPGREMYPTVSPDGQTVVFSADWRSHDTVFDLYAAPIGDPSGLVPVFEGPISGSDLVFSFLASWSPGGQWIAFSDCGNTIFWCQGPGNSRLTRIRPDGTDRQVVTETTGGADPTWSPDGAWLGYTSQDCSLGTQCIRAVPFTGGGSLELISDARMAAWRPR